MAGLSRHLGVRRKLLYALIENGTIPAVQHPATGHYLVPVDAALLERLQAEIVPALYSTPVSPQPDYTA